jgi:ABC-type transporter Mla subunit MlaD
MSAFSGLRKQVGNVSNGLTNGKQRQDALSRIGALEGRFEVLVSQLNKALSGYEEKMDSLARFVDALSTITGNDTVTKTVQEKRIVELDAQADQQMAAVEAAVTDGRLVASEVVNSDEQIVITTQSKDGNPMHPWCVVIPLSGYTEEAKTAIVGKEKGYSTLISDGSKLEILGIYNFVKKPVAQSVDNQSQTRTSAETSSESSVVEIVGSSDTAGA